MALVCQLLGATWHEFESRKPQPSGLSSASNYKPSYVNLAVDVKPDKACYG